MAHVTLPPDKIKCIGSLKSHKWLYSCRGSRLSTNSLHPPPLWILALGSLLRNIRHVTASDLRTLPLALVERAWRRIRAAQLDSGRVWQVFAPLVDKSKRIDKIDDRTLQANLNLSHYVPGLDSVKLDWLVHLLLCDLCPTVHELTDLGRMANLVKLTISKTSSTNDSLSIDDNALRAMGRQARDLARFPRLHHLVLAGHERVTDKAFRHLALLPNLQVLETLYTGIREGPEHVLRWSEGFDAYARTEWERPLLEFWIGTDDSLKECGRVGWRYFLRVSGPEEKEPSVADPGKSGRVIKASKRQQIGFASTTLMTMT